MSTVVAEPERFLNLIEDADTAALHVLETVGTDQRYLKAIKESAATRARAVGTLWEDIGAPLAMPAKRPATLPADREVTNGNVATAAGTSACDSTGPVKIGPARRHVPDRMPLGAMPLKVMGYVSVSQNAGSERCRS